MEYIGRMAEILLCIVCLTLVPAKNMLRICEKQRGNVLEVQAERFYAEIRQGGSLGREAYERFRENVEGDGIGSTFELMVARNYVMPAAKEGTTGYGVPMKILYRSDIEEMLLESGAIALDRMAFINISIYGREGLLYSCGGGVW